PESLIQAAAEVIVARTGGRFDAVVRLIEATEHGGTWTALAGQASAGTTAGGLDLDTDFS
ncbi:MAG: hypothetical protein KDK70_36595, partial [Myxococcales bacterium]|nr:hypothetical protein [Myxococcales bacterium]